ncbi:cytochrome P450 2D6-like isoform X2 [Nycticebus coucang]|uniref:cytochrome P450 2D6-like isoform X2 n=1 Tax=Nycticebus coucang TaxID=9470 RepID=UPI00234D6F3E|nr:cytochrome P450 2D6-like isoform X2 [Nycticebus coucang]
MGLLTGDVLTTLALAMAVFLLLVDLMHRCPRWAARYPPGPMPLPGLGNLLQVDFQDISYCFSKLQRRFGDVYSLQLGWTPVVVLNGLVAVREALVKHNEDTADRPPTPILEYLGFGPRSEGIFQARYGPAWREQRRFSVSTLRLFGLGKKSLEQWVTEEASCLCAAFADHAGRPFSPSESLNKAVTNVMASLTYGRRFEYDDPRFLRLLTLMNEVLLEQSSFLIQMLNFIPVLLRIPGLVHKVIPRQREFMALLDELVTEHRMTWDPAQPPRDLTDAFLAEVEKAKGNPESSFNDENLRLVVSDLFSAGMVTTSTTLVWALLLMILHPDVQRRVQQEIDEVIGQVRRPEMSDQAHMPFTTAVIHEVQRFGDIVPLGVPHMTSRDIEVQGFLIPKVRLSGGARLGTQATQSSIPQALTAPAWVGSRAEARPPCPGGAQVWGDDKPKSAPEFLKMHACRNSGLEALIGGETQLYQGVRGCQEGSWTEHYFQASMCMPVRMCACVFGDNCPGILKPSHYSC